MKQRIVLVGQSPLSYFLASELDRQLGGLVQTELVWLPAEPAVAHLATVANLLDRTSHGLPRLKLPNISVRPSTIKSINLNERRIITERGTVNYDYLFVDNRPAYRPSELEAIRAELMTLFSSLQTLSRAKSQTARLYCPGKLPDAWQLALLIQGALHHHYPRLVGQIKLIIDSPSGQLGIFLRRSGLQMATAANLKLPGLTIQPPQPLINNRSVRGWQTGHNGRVQLTAALSPIGFPAVTVFEGDWLNRLTLLRVFRTIARQAVGRLALQLDGESQSPFILPAAALGVLATGGHYVAIGSLENHRLRARFVHLLERQLRARLAD